jgi:DNA (cytosine-5)-methyltransferase 1
MNAVGLFAGIGGLERGFLGAGFHSVLMSENDLGCQAVLKKRFTDTKITGDVAALRRLPMADVLLAGFPCQPYSPVGPTLGWRVGAWHLRQIFRLLDSTRRMTPTVVLENVPFFLHLDNGIAIKALLRGFEVRGYQWAYRIVDAAAFGRPQRRRRWLFVASRVLDPASILLAQDRPQPVTVATEANGFYWTEGNSGLGWANDSIPPLKPGSRWGIAAPPAIWHHDSGRILLPDLRDAERLQGFPENWSRATDRVDTVDRQRWRMVGNAVNVSVARWLAKRIASPDYRLIDGEQITKQVIPKAAYFDGHKRYVAHVGEFPLVRAALPITQFLRHDGKPLSKAATRGFRTRYEASNLRKKTEFIDALRHHERNIDNEQEALAPTD